MKKIKICYIDDEHDTYLSNFLSKLVDFDYEDIDVLAGETVDDVINKIVEKNCNIAVIDSKLYKDSNAQQKITGEEIELFLGNRLPYIFSIVVSQNEDIDNYNYIKKFKSSDAKTSDGFEESYQYYNDELNSILHFARDKISRFNKCFKKELSSKKDVFDSLKLENIESLLEGKDVMNISKSDIDTIIQLLNDIVEYEN